VIRIGELRHGNDDRARAFITYAVPGGLIIQLSWGTLGESARDFVRRYSASESARLLQSERMIDKRPLSADEVTAKLREWRKRCKSDGFHDFYEVYK